ncbi:hypothetical protein [Streptosporangium sp. NPDC002544]
MKWRIIKMAMTRLDDGVRAVGRTALTYVSTPSQPKIDHFLGAVALTRLA